MKKEIQKIFLLVFVIVGALFCDSKIVDADGMCSSSSALPPGYFIVSGGSNETFEGHGVGYIYDKKTRTEGYCSDEGAGFANSNCYVLDGTFNDGKFCEYVVNNQTKKGDCSRIVANIISEAKRRYGDYFHTQAAVWGYLGKFVNFPVSNPQKASDNPYKYWNSKTAYDNYPFVKQIIDAAFNNYANSSESAEPIVKVVDNLITVKNHDNNFYYVPGDSCSANGGYYRTKEFTIESLQNKNVTVKIKTNYNDKVKISVDGSLYDLKDGEYKRQFFGTQKSINVYLRTSAPIDDLQVYIEAEMEGEKQDVRVNTLDCVRYHGDGGQGVIQLTDGDYEIIPVAVIYRQNYTFNYVFNKVENMTCEQYSNDNPNGTSDGEEIHKAGELVEKKCVNSLITPGGNKRAPDKKNYVANYANCNCMTIDLDGGKKVNIRIYENTSFRFGILNPTIVYPGGGFRFAKKDESITTDYVSNITWRYVDYNADGTPYYYNPDNLSDNSVSDEMHNQINDMVRNMINDGDKLSIKDKLDLKFSTVDSNTGEDVSVVISNQLNKTETTPFIAGSNGIAGREYVVVTVKTDDNGMSMNHAYFSVDGMVNYAEAETNDYPIDGGNNYYLPMRYGKAKFPFNISEEANLSALNNGGYKFRYIADCAVSVGADPDEPVSECEEDDDCDPKFFDKSIAYRSIDLNNPFPRATANGDGIKENWKEWYSSSANKQRLKDSFNNHPNQPLYSINMNNELLSRIGNIDSFYASWSGVEKNGFDSFLRDYGVDYSRASGSYCEINQFDSECDR